MSCLGLAADLDLVADLVLEADFGHQTLEVGFHPPISEADFCRQVSEADFDFDSWPHFEAELEAALEADLDQVDLTCWPRSEAVSELQFEADLQLNIALFHFVCPLEAAFFQVEFGRQFLEAYFFPLEAAFCFGIVLAASHHYLEADFFQLECHLEADFSALEAVF